jgi:TRAP transporter TAXI family solute receptor
MKRRVTLLAVAIVLGIAGVIFSAVFISRMPRTLTLAVGPGGQETHRYAEAIAKVSQDGRDRIRYRIVTTSGAKESAQLLEDGKVNLAVIRSDYELPANGQTIVVNTKRSVVVIAPQLRRGGIRSFADLKGKRVAVGTLADSNMPLVRRMLAVGELGENDVTLIEAKMNDLPEVLGTGQADAAIAVVVPGAPGAAELVPQIAKRLPGGMRFIPLTEAEAMANRIIGVETAELPAGLFGAGRPQEEIATIAISYRIMARSAMPEGLAGEVAKSLYDMRARLSRVVPVAFSMEPADALTGARLPVHPGAAAHFDGETKTFMERYGDALLSGLWGISILGSAITAFLAWFAGRRVDHGGPMLAEIAALTAEARAATAAALPPIEARIDEIVGALARHHADGQLAEGVIDSASLALDHFRNVADTARLRVG